MNKYLRLLARFLIYVVVGAITMVITLGAAAGIAYLMVVYTWACIFIAILVWVTYIVGQGVIKALINKYS